MEPLQFKLHRHHAGERQVQAWCRIPEGRSEVLEEMTENEVSDHRLQFLQDLSCLAIGVLNSEGEIWTTLLSLPKIQRTGAQAISISCQAAPSDPFVRGSLEGSFPKYFAGVGVLFENRRRNKLAGNITSAKLSGDGRLELQCICNENLGNCPKYITVRQLAAFSRPPTSPATTSPNLSPAALSLLNRASTMFLASGHFVKEEVSSLLGLNHRGGPPGFIRHFLDPNGLSRLVFPDFSGNLFYSSLGNIQSDGRVGLVVPDFVTGDLLQVTGRARNLFDAEAQALMPRTRLVTLIAVERVVYQPAALQLALLGPEQLSPYNPPLRPLASELANFVESPGRTATLTSVETECSTMKTFTFALNEPAEVSPGGYAIFDFSELLKRRYQHMAPGDPQSVNDAFVRTWTVSSLSPDRRSLAITVKLKPSGRISHLLHSLPSPPPPLALKLQGFGGEFGLPDPLPARLVWLAGGAGITPFLALAQAPTLQASRAHVLLLFSCRGDEAEILRKFRPVGWTLEVRIYDSSSNGNQAGNYPTFPRRLQAEELASLDPEAEIFFCGPSALHRLVSAALKDRKIHSESFEF